MSGRTRTARTRAIVHVDCRRGHHRTQDRHDRRRVRRDAVRPQQAREGVVATKVRHSPNTSPLAERARSSAMPAMRRQPQRPRRRCRNTRWQRRRSAPTRVSADVNALFEDVVARHGKLDIVVHVPGAVIKKPLAEFTDADFDHLIDLNTRSAFNTLRATARHIADNGRYVVLPTTLTAVMTGPYGVHSGSKAAVERMVLAAAEELGGR